MKDKLQIHLSMKNEKPENSQLVNISFLFFKYIFQTNYDILFCRFRQHCDFSKDQINIQQKHLRANLLDSFFRKCVLIQFKWIEWYYWNISDRLRTRLLSCEKQHKISSFQQFLVLTAAIFRSILFRYINSFNNTKAFCIILKRYG